MSMYENLLDSVLNNKRIADMPILMVMEIFTVIIEELEKSTYV